MVMRGRLKRGDIVWLFTILAFMAFVSTSSALNSEANRSTLKGLVGVRVLVEDLAPEMERSGLRKTKLHTDVEQRLKKGGVKVLTQEECLKTAGEPYLYININTAVGKPQSNLYLYSIDIGLIQNVVLERDPKVTTYAITWSTGGVGLIEKELLNQLGESVLNIVDMFIEAHQSVNKKSPK